MRRFSKVWSLKVECIHQMECQFLDLHLSKGSGWRSTALLEVAHLKQLVGARMGIEYAQQLISHKIQFEGFVGRLILPSYIGSLVR